MPTFIETQFPIARLSAESYKERKANSSQTLTRNPFDIKYSKVEDADWETCASVLNSVSMKELLSRGW